MNRVPSPPAASSLADRRQRLEEYLRKHDLAAVWFGRPNSFAWLTGGSNVVDRHAPVGVAAAGYDRTDGFRVITNSIEADRLREEVVPDAFTVENTAWYTGSLADAVDERSPSPAAADFDIPGFERCDPTTLRQPLTDADIEQYRTLGRDTASALESVGRSLSATDTERQAAAAIHSALESQAITAPVVLVGGSERAQRYRHYTPTTAELGEYALLSVTAERDGRYASATRTVAFDAPAWLAERHRAVATVEVSALAATQQAAAAGETAGDVFSDIKDAYAAVGHPDEWTHHHQGGAAGFAGREWIATPTHTARVYEPMAYAWNPTVQGAKSEGTVLVTADSIEPLTLTGEWPTIETSAVSSVDSNCTLSRPDILFQ